MGWPARCCVRFMRPTRASTHHPPIMQQRSLSRYMAHGPHAAASNCGHHSSHYATAVALVLHAQGPHAAASDCGHHSSHSATTVALRSLSHYMHGGGLTCHPVSWLMGLPSRHCTSSAHSSVAHHASGSCEAGLLIRACKHEQRAAMRSCWAFNAFRCATLCDRFAASHSP